MIRKREQLRMIGGSALLEVWSRDANQADKNAVYEVLFTVAGCVPRRADGTPVPYEVAVPARPGLLVRLVFPAADTFGLLAIETNDERLHHPPNAA